MTAAHLATHAPSHGGALSLGLVVPGLESRLTRTAGFGALVLEFPHVAVRVLGHCPEAEALVIPEWQWQHPLADLYRWDAAVLTAIEHTSSIVILASGSGESVAHSAGEILTRYQRLALRRNPRSSGAEFTRAFAAHQRLHDLDKPLVRADYDHALDAWQWLLRLVPDASLALQLAALFHDVERLATEADVRVEQHAPDYQAFKEAHARSGAEAAARTLFAAGVGPETCREVQRLIERHERPRAALGARDRGLEALADADALSFFSLNSPGFADYYGPAHTELKVRYSLGRMSPRARRLVERVRLRGDVARLVAAARSADTTAPHPEAVP